MWNKLWEWGKVISREIILEIITVVQMKDDSGLDQGSNRKG